ncbi:MAG: thioredoxin-disulfide reductase [Thermodesulfobacteriota bacterium]|nr:thioredoxin-disulfide reductase [Thermodesulfobacteriota bacterium]
MDSNGKFYDVAIIGGGPAGLTAGIYTSRANLGALLIEGQVNPSQITVTDLVENYPGFPEGITGFDLVGKFKAQALKFGLDIIQENIHTIARTSINSHEGWKIETDFGAYETLSVIMATGATWDRLGVPGEAELTGRGVSYCATCDAPFFRGSTVIVVGGGDTAIQESLYLTKFAKEVIVVHRRNRLRAAGMLQEKAFSNEKISFIWDSVVEKILGSDTVSGVRLRNVKTGRINDVAAEGVFIFVGNTPNSGLVRNVVKLDGGGSILVDKDMRASADGFFACGDCTDTSLKQVVTACGDGARAAYSTQIYVEEMKGVIVR